MHSMWSGRRALAWASAAVLVTFLTGAALGVASASAAELPAQIREIMDKPRYADAKWSLLVKDLDTGRTTYALRPDEMSFTGSTRKLFSVGAALEGLGPGHRETTRVVRRGKLDVSGRLHGGLVLVAGGDLTLGGRRVGADGIQFTDFDHNDANALGAAEPTPQDPLAGLDRLAREVRASGVRSVSGDVAVDDRLFRPYRVPNGNLLITPIMVNENMVDVTLAPTAPGKPAALSYRPRSQAFGVDGSVETVASGGPAEVSLSGGGRVGCVGEAACVGVVDGTLPVGYVAPLTGLPTFVRTFRIENPTDFARTAFIEALRRAGITVTAPTVAPDPRGLLSPSRRYPATARLAALRSAPYAQLARLVLKVSLNLGANLSLSLFGLSRGERTVEGSLAAERRYLVHRFGVNPRLFDFPTNGSGTPDSRAAPRALVQLLSAVAAGPVAGPFADSLPILGRDGSLAHTGTTLPARGHVLAKTGTTIAPTAAGDSLELKAQNLAGYIDAANGHRLAFALMVNDAGEIDDIEGDVAGVFEDQARITNVIYKDGK
jgi:D-alanyl-D-alanine carboxypeptidase/D-alanyl-D-alanine-endopeptidase (penicillin-binding protein 4)